MEREHGLKSSKHWEKTKKKKINKTKKKASTCKNFQTKKGLLIFNKPRVLIRKQAGKKQE